MKRENTKSVRVNTEWETRMRKIMMDRYTNKLASPSVQSLSVSEASRLVLKCPSWKKVEEELRRLPKRSRR